LASSADETVDLTDIALRLRNLLTTKRISQVDELVKVPQIRSAPSM
jgi:hypothetical protein